MKAAVQYRGENRPRYEEVETPIAQKENELMLAVKAAAIKHFDRSVASGRHYSAKGAGEARVIGGDGVGVLEDGRRVFALGISGMTAEKAVIDRDRMVELPEGISNEAAAALPNAAAGSAMALLYRAQIKKGETVLINGATGFTGRLAVQLAKHYGAKTVIATGRNGAALPSLLPLGADLLLSLDQTDEAIEAQLKDLHHQTPIDIIIDYLWGHTAELLLAALKGDGSFSHPTRFVSVGAVTGDTIQLSAENLRSTDLRLCGSGLGSWSRGELRSLFQEILPELFHFMAMGKLSVETVSLPLHDIECIGEIDLPSGRRLVITIP